MIPQNIIRNREIDIHCHLPVFASEGRAYFRIKINSRSKNLASGGEDMVQLGCVNRPDCVVVGDALTMDQGCWLLTDVAACMGHSIVYLQLTPTSDMQTTHLLKRGRWRK